MFSDLREEQQDIIRDLTNKNIELQNVIQRLQKENEGLKSLNDFNVQKIEVLQEENEKLNKALEEVREQYVNKAFFKCDKTEEECPCHNCIILGQLDRVQNIIKIIDEVLNDRD